MICLLVFSHAVVIFGDTVKSACLNFFNYALTLKCFIGKGSSNMGKHSHAFIYLSHSLETEKLA